MLEVFIMKKILVVILAVAMVLSLAAAAFAAGSPVTPPAAPGSGTNAGGGAGAGAGAGAGGAKAKGNYIVKFSTGETQKGVVAEEPFDDDGVRMTLMKLRRLSLQIIKMLLFPVSSLWVKMQ